MTTKRKKTMARDVYASPEAAIKINSLMRRAVSAHTNWITWPAAPLNIVRATSSDGVFPPLWTWIGPARAEKWAIAIAHSIEPVQAAYGVGLLDLIPRRAGLDKLHAVCVFTPEQIEKGGESAEFFEELVDAGCPIVLDCREEDFPFEEDDGAAWGIAYTKPLPPADIASYVRSTYQDHLGRLWSRPLFLEANGSKHNRKISLAKSKAFAQALSLGKHSIPQFASKGRIMPGWRREVLDSIGKTAADEETLLTLKNLDALRDIFELWERYLDVHNLSIRIDSKEFEDEEKAVKIFSNIAKTIGVDSCIDLYEQGLSVEDILGE